MLQQSIQEINTAVLENPMAYLQQIDAGYHKQLLTAARQIYDIRGEKPIILLAGPSGSGKTTTAMMLEQILDSWGAETHTLSMDNYFLSFTPQEQELVAAGRIDLESPDRVDIPFLNRQLTQILGCQPTALPKYRFQDTKRIDSGQTLTRKPGDLVILEGIHALNPDVITVPPTHTFRIYVSVRTRITDGKAVLQPSYLRLLRRIIRDRLFRRRSIEETLEMMERVELGEQRYIMPYKRYANLELDTFHAYELGVYKQLLEKEVQALEKLPEAAVLQTILQNTVAVSTELVSKDALIREFIGDGSFCY